ncbi:YiiD C-terminal domain-containing protein [Xanthomonas sp. XNM01]|uniref:YiiD C-terminal domain-containing protein n=1 Tax=Xanthomonas sp. XNM01 TaxID=2769289 RepID=UPI001CE170A2|nr:YiiD C-terminal domain-containing protein [Xanthomonas sp. XNM01]
MSVPMPSTPPHDLLEPLRGHYRSIPQVLAMQVDVAGYADGRLRLTAPLAPNINDKGSAFGGSLVSLLTLAGWGLTTLQLSQAGLEADVFVADSDVRYLAPLYAALEAEAELEDGDWAGFVATFRQRGRARCRIRARILLPDGGEATTLSGRFVALARS